MQATKRSRVLSFYTIPEYEEWREGEGGSGWEIKYYKGLGTSTKEEAIEYFSDIDRHRKEFVWQGMAIVCQFPDLGSHFLMRLKLTACQQEFELGWHLHSG